MISFIGSNIPFVDSGLLQAIRDTVSAIDLGSLSSGFITLLEDRQHHLSRGDSTDQVTNQLESSETLWRQQVRSIVEEMMAPDQIIWTDDEESLDDHYFAQHVLLKIKDRFEM